MERFDYDPMLDLEPVVAPAEVRAEATLYDVSYHTASTAAVAQALLMVPFASAPFPFVMFLQGGGQDRTSFLAEGWRLANLGIMSLQIDLPQAREFPDFSNPTKEQEKFVQTIITARRGIDYLVLRRDVDVDRGALVGFSFGAWVGSVVAAVESRVKAAVLISGVSFMSEFWRNCADPAVEEIRRELPPTVLDRYIERTKSLDAARYIQRCSHLRLLFQFGSGDEFVSKEDREEFVRHAGCLSQVKSYNTTSHYQMFLHPDAREDRVCWLNEQLHRLGEGTS